MPRDKGIFVCSSEISTVKKDDLCRECVLHISRPRINGYKVNRREDDLDALARYLWNIELSSALFPALDAFEVCFRNAVYTSVADHHSNPLWLVDGSILKNKEKAAVEKEVISVQDERRRKFRNHPDRVAILAQPVSINDVIPKMTLGFWHGIFKGDYAAAIAIPCLDVKGRLYPLKPDFLNHQGLLDKVRPILTLRNRVAHHEPICKNPGRTKSHYDSMIRYTRLISPTNADLTNCIDNFDYILNKSWEPYRSEIYRKMIS